VHTLKTPRVGSRRVLDGSPCIVCGQARRVRVASWSARCESCGSWASDLPVGGAEVESETRIAGYESLRRANARAVLERLGELRDLRDATLLDIGSAYGWFLEEATLVGASATGIESDENVAARSYGNVRVGRFPDAVDSGDRFDVIAFNDVLEHIPDLRGAIDTSREHLREKGLLSVNIPTADGVAFRTAAKAARLGITGPYERLWQYGLASPHLHYLSTQGLVTLLRESGLKVRLVAQLPSITRTGLWQRVHTVRRASPSSAIGFAALYAAAGVLNRAGLGDIVHVIAERADD
jgi:2-polyprenyl-3-methyl-5-hydroxy-6-metoxy-1,4-benzoquinol methylase